MKARKKVLAYLLIFTLIITSLPTQLFSKEKDVASAAKKDLMKNEKTTSSMIEINENKFVGDGYEVEFKVSSHWPGAFNGELVLTNTGEKALENWTLKFDFEHEITNMWNGQIIAHEGNSYIIKNLGWNQDIAPGRSVNIGFGAKWSEAINSPSNYDLLIAEQQVEDSNYTIAFKVTSDWGQAFNGEISITNNTEETIEDWILEFDFDRNIQRFWTAEIVKHEANHYVIKNAGYNANIAPGQTLKLGFAGNPGNVDNEPTGYKLNQIGQEIDYTKDTDGDGLPDFFEKILGTNINKTDTDSDGLPDGYEYFILETDPLKPDTDDNGILDGDEDFDNDGLTNYEEYLLETDPYSEDTDDDDLTDGDEVNIHQTDPKLYDTDGDGLSDGDDILLGFDPLLPDTNSNGILDSKEKINQTIVREIEDSEKKEVERVSVNLNCAGNIKKQVKIENIYKQDILSSSVVGLIGVPVEIESDTEFEQAIITFTYNESMLGSTQEKDLAVMWYDEENDKYHIFDKDSVIDTVNNTVSYSTTHFSTYLLVDRQQWYNAWKYNIDYTRTETTKLFYDIGFVVDTSGSMSGNPITTMKTGLSSFIDAMYDGDDASLIYFNSYAYLVNQFGSTKAQLKSGINSLYASGGTDTDAGLRLGISNILAKDSSNEKIIIMICDGDVRYVQSTIDRAKQNNIKIYTINIAYASSHAALEKIASETGGKYYFATTVPQLLDVLMQIQCQTITGIDKTDTDGDGLYDIIESKGVRISNGTILTSDPLIPDTDEDGLLDSEEIVFKEDLLTYSYSQFTKEELSKLGLYDFESFNKSSNLPTATYCSAYSNPRSKHSDSFSSEMGLRSAQTVNFMTSSTNYTGYGDGDGDGLSDAFDPKPWDIKNNGKKLELSLAEVVNLQLCLQMMGYLYTDEGYGTYGGITRTAVNIYQLNHGFELTDAYIDSNTYATIINAHLNMYSSNPKNEYNQMFNKDTRIKKKYFKLTPRVAPVLSDAYKKEGVKLAITDNSTIKSGNSATFNIYLYDYTIPIEKMLNRNAHEAIKHRNDVLPIKWIWFFNKVNHNMEWDIKVEKQWNKQFNDIEHYSTKFPFVFNNITMNPETLGNFTYGYWGRCADISLETLLSGGDFAAFTGDIKKFKITFTDPEEDKIYVNKGVDHYRKVYGD